MLRRQRKQSITPFTSPDRRFNIEVPESTKPLPKKLSLEEETLSELFGSKQAAELFEIKLSPKEEEASSQVITFYTPNPLSGKKFKDDVNGHMTWLFGDDKKFSKEADAVVNGLPAREFIFEKGSGSGRAMFVNAGKRIYLLAYFVENGGEPTSEVVQRMFASFKPNK
jgi:hypothetical protein